MSDFFQRRLEKKSRSDLHPASLSLYGFLFACGIGFRLAPYDTPKTASATMIDIDSRPFRSAARSSRTRANPFFAVFSLPAFLLAPC